MSINGDDPSRSTDVLVKFKLSQLSAFMQLLAVGK